MVVVRRSIVDWVVFVFGVFGWMGLSFFPPCFCGMDREDWVFLDREKGAVFIYLVLLSSA